MSEGRMRPGDFLRVCDRTGFVVPASKTRKEWNGQIVKDSVFERRHPQDFVKAKPERRGVMDARPRPVDIFGGPLQTTVTAAATAGDLSLTVESTARFADGDHIGTPLATGDVHSAIVQSVPGSTTLLLTAALPGAVEIGATVTNYSAVATANIG